MAGYVLGATTATKLELNIEGYGPVNNLPVLPPGKHFLPDADTIERAIMAEGEVTVTLAGTIKTSKSSSSLKLKIGSSPSLRG
jgi:hypothetical protein